MDGLSWPAVPVLIHACFQMLCQLLQSLLGLLAAAGCSLVSFTGLSQGPLCLYQSPSGQSWGVPLQPIPDQ